MATLNLGRALQLAGVKGAKPGPMSLEEAKELSKKKDKPVQSTVALGRLAEEFAVLGETGTGIEFIRELSTILQPHCKWNPGTDVEVTIHVVRGLSQLIHQKRDAATGSKRASWAKPIAIISKVKERFEKNPPKNGREYLLQEVSR